MRSPRPTCRNCAAAWSWRRRPLRPVTFRSARCGIGAAPWLSAEPDGGSGHAPSMACPAVRENLRRLRLRLERATAVRPETCAVDLRLQGHFTRLARGGRQGGTQCRGPGGHGDRRASASERKPSVSARSAAQSITRSDRSGRESAQPGARVSPPVPPPSPPPRSVAARGSPRPGTGPRSAPPWLVPAGG